MGKVHMSSTGCSRGAHVHHTYTYAPDTGSYACNGCVCVCMCVYCVMCLRVEDISGGE